MDQSLRMTRQNQTLVNILIKPATSEIVEFPGLENQEGDQGESREIPLSAEVHFW